MLDAWIIKRIEQERQRQQEEAERERPRVEMPVPPPDWRPTPEQPEEKRGVCIIQM